MKRLYLPALAALTLGWAASPSHAQYVYPNSPGQPVAPVYYQQPMPQMPMGQMPMGQMPMGQMPMGQMMPGSPVMPVGAMAQPMVVPVYVPVVQQRIPMFGPVETMPEGGPLASPEASVAPVSAKSVEQPVVRSTAKPWYQKAKTFLFGN
jgi:hypothetical protein